MAVRKIHNAWWVDIRLEGQRHRFRSPDDSRAGAKAYEATLRSRVARGEEARPKPAVAVPTLVAFVPDWLKNYVEANNRPCEHEAKASRLRKHLLPFFGRMRLDAIGEAELERYKAIKKASNLAPKTINNQLAILGRLLRTANEWGIIQKVPRMKMLKSPPSRFDFLSPEEGNSLLRAALPEPLWFGFILCALRTGLRRGEIFGLSWPDIDFTRRQLTVCRSIVNGHVGAPKNNRIRYVPLSNDLLAYLQSRAKPDGYVFAQPDGKPLDAELARLALERTLRRSGLRHIGWHVLRHSFASQLVAANVPIRVVQELMGHSTIVMTMRYAHLTPSALHDAISVLPTLGNSSSKESGHQMGTKPDFPALEAPKTESIEALISAMDKQKRSSAEKHFCW